MGISEDSLLLSAEGMYLKVLVFDNKVSADVEAISCKEVALSSM